MSTATSVVRALRTVCSDAAMRRLCSAAAGVALLLSVQPTHADEPTEAQHLPVIRLNAGIRNIAAELADTPREREIGLMFRDRLGDNAGMLFAFETPGVQCFWMRNTLVALSAAFIADDGTVVNIVDMAPQTLDSHCSTAPVRFVLEMAQGWFAKAGVRPGSRLSGGPFAASH